MKIAILGGTGKEGSGLGFRWAAAGHEVIIGSRTEEKGRRAAEELQAALPDAIIRGCDNVTACLLYTSPSPRDRTRSRMPSSA